MEKITLQTTVKELEAFLSAYHRKTGTRPTMNEALEIMEKNHLLSSAHASAASETKTYHNVDEICAMIDAQPLDATAYLQNTVTSDNALRCEEDALFAPGRDVAVTRLFSCLSVEPIVYACFSIIVTLKGSCEVVFDGTPLTLEVGGIVIVPPQTPHTVSIPTESYVATIHIRRSTFDAQFGDLMTCGDVMSVFLRESLYGEKETNYLHMVADFDIPDTISVLHPFVRECASKAPLANLCAASWLKIFLAAAYRAHSESVSVFRSARDEATRADCGAILQYIQQNYRTVRLSSLAKRFHYNETYLSRMLQNYMGMSYTDIVRGIKMTRAEDYLNNSNLRVNEISSLVGYESVDHFSRTFKATHNMSPQAYRRSCTRHSVRRIDE